MIGRIIWELGSTQRVNLGGARLLSCIFAPLHTLPGVDIKVQFYTCLFLQILNLKLVRVSTCSRSEICRRSEVRAIWPKDTIERTRWVDQQKHPGVKNYVLVSKAQSKTKKVGFELVCSQLVDTVPVKCLWKRRSKSFIIHSKVIWPDLTLGSMSEITRVAGMKIVL